MECYCGKKMQKAYVVAAFKKFDEGFNAWTCPDKEHCGKLKPRKIG